MEQFRSGWKQSYYGKGDVTVYRLRRQGGECPVFGVNVKMLLYGEAFWPTYTTGDNTNLVATDSMKNFIQRETLHYHGNDHGSLRVCSWGRSFWLSIHRPKVCRSPRRRFPIRELGTLPSSPLDPRRRSL